MNAMQFFQTREATSQQYTIKAQETWSVYVFCCDLLSNPHEIFTVKISFSDKPIFSLDQDLFTVVKMGLHMTVKFSSVSLGCYLDALFYV
jgi:hypothetical protein